MGICYKLILEDEWDWGYCDTTKDAQLKEFEQKFGRYIERVTEWDHFVVYDIDKASPFDKGRQNLIREYADCAYYVDDLGTGINKIDLPVNKTSVQYEIDHMNARRTLEQKKASEDYIRNKLSENTEKQVRIKDSETVNEIKDSI